MVFTFGRKWVWGLFTELESSLLTLQYSCSLACAYLLYSHSMSPVNLYLEGGCIAGGTVESLVSQASSSHLSYTYVKCTWKCHKRCMRLMAQLQG